MNYQEWEEFVPQEFKADSLWKMTAYRYALFASDLGWSDVTKLIKDKRTIEIADQLYRSLGSISANLAEGYSRGRTLREEQAEYLAENIIESLLQNIPFAE